MQVCANFFLVRRQVVEIKAKQTRRVSTQNMTRSFFIQRGLYFFDGTTAERKRAFVMRIVVAPHQAIGAGQSDIVEGNRIVG